MKIRRPAIHFWIAALTLGALIWTVPLGAQSPSYTPQDRDSDMSRQPAYQQQDRDFDMSRRQLADFDRFLDSHPQLAEQIRKDPTLVNNEEFVENHGDLQQYLQQHPEVREQLRQNPNAVMRQEQRYDRREDRMQDRDRDMNRDQDRTQDRDRDMSRDQDRTQDRDRDMSRDQDRIQDRDRDRSMNRDQDRDRDITRGELSNLNNFMDSHPEIAEQLKKNPALVNDKKFVESHPALKGFLAADPGVREEMRENPNGFMAREQQFDLTDANSRELANMDRFMDSHPEIAEQLRKNPALVNDKKFVENHKALKTFLASHPYAAQEYKENPSAFMQQEQSFEHQQQNYATRRDQDFGTRRDQDYGMRAGNQDMRSQGVTGDRDRMGTSVSSFNEFLEHHGNIASDLSKNPSLATNEEYVETHPALRQYLQANPKVRQELSANPQSFVKSAQTFEAAPKGSPKLPSDPKLK
jgi:phage-related protein